MKTLKLKTPIKNLEGEPLTVLKLRPYVTVGDLLTAQKVHGDSDTEQSIFLVSQVTGLDTSEVELLDANDFTKLTRHVSAIMPNLEEEDPKEG